jgi:hypothetical protein
MGSRSAAFNGATALANELDDPGDEDRLTPLHLPPPPRVPNFGRYQPRAATLASGFLLDPNQIGDVLSSANMVAASPASSEAPVAPPAANSPVSVARVREPSPAASTTSAVAPAPARWRPRQLALAAAGCVVVIVIALFASHVVSLPLR